MQEAINRPSPSSSWSSSSSSSSSNSSATTSTTAGEVLGRMAAENPVLALGRRGCCMTHVVTRLLQGLGVNPAVCEVGEEEAALVEDLVAEMTGAAAGHRQMLFPAVFIGGRLVGGLDRLMAVHISGELVPILKEAGALWL